jgi:hypothetical protein
MAQATLPNVTPPPVAPAPAAPAKAKVASKPKADAPKKVTRTKEVVAVELPKSIKEAVMAEGGATYVRELIMKDLLGRNLMQYNPPQS